jgi:hypothetical protein
MESNVELYQPARLYVRSGWAAFAGSLICAVCGLEVRLAFIPACICAVSAAVLFWMGSRPSIRISATQFNVGERAIAWREVREINGGFGSPLLIRIKLTNARQKLIVFPGEGERIARLMYQLRRHSYLATFDGVAYRDFWTWSTLNDANQGQPVLKQPVRMLSAEDEDEIERMFHKLKSVGRLDVRSDDVSPGGD